MKQALYMVKWQVMLMQFLLVANNVLYLQAQEDKRIESKAFHNDSITLLDAVNVEAYQVSSRLRSIPGSLSVLTGESIVPGDGTNLASALNMLPGVSMQSGTYTTNRIVIRGMGSRTPYNTNRIRSYLNDIPLTTSDGVSTPEEIDLHGIGRMEIVKGPSSALYGSGLGGSINLFTATNTESMGVAGVQFGSFNTAKINLSGSYNRENSGIWASLGHLQSDGYRENNDYRRTSLLTTSVFKRSKWSIGLTFLLMGADGGIPSSVGKSLLKTDPQAAAPSWKAIGGYKEYVKGLAGITLTNNLTANLINRLTVFGRAHDHYERRPFNNLDDQTVSAGIRDKLSLHHEKTDLVLGVEWISEEYLWKLDTSDVMINRNREKRDQLNVFGLVYYRPAPNVNISFGGAINHIRYRLTDLFMFNGDQAGEHIFPLLVSPRLGINYAPYEYLALYASAGHGFSLPSPEETLLPEGNVNTDIKPEQGFQFEIGSRLNMLNGNFAIDGTLYWIELDDLLVTKRVTEDIFTGVNAGKTRHQGFELMLNGRIFRHNEFPGKLTTVFTYTRSLNRFIEFTDAGNTFDGNHLPGIPDHQLSGMLKWSPDKVITLDFDCRYTGRQYLDDGNTMRYSSYLVTNLKLSGDVVTKKVGRINIYAGINNFTNTKYASMLIVNAQGFEGSEPRYYYPGLPRHTYVGMRFILDKH